MMVCIAVFFYVHPSLFLFLAVSAGCVLKTTELNAVIAKQAEEIRGLRRRLRPACPASGKRKADSSLAAAQAKRFRP